MFHPLLVYIHMYSRHSKYGRSATPTSIDSSEDTDSSSLSSHTMDGLEGKDEHGGLLQGEGVRVHPILDVPIPPVSAGDCVIHPPRLTLCDPCTTVDIV